MATINEVQSILGETDSGHGASISALWETLTETNTTGRAVGLSALPDRSVQVVGTFGGTSISLYGSNDGATWVILNDPLGDPLTFTSAGLRQVAELTRYVRPLVTGGTGVDLDVYMLFGGPRR